VFLVAFGWLSSGFHLIPPHPSRQRRDTFSYEEKEGGKSGERAAKSGKDGKRVMVEREELLVL